MFDTGLPMLLGGPPMLWSMHGTPPDVLGEIADAIVAGQQLDHRRVFADLATFGHTPLDLACAVAARRRGATRTVPQFFHGAAVPVC